MRVLLIEDDEDLCAAVAQGLEAAGYAVDQCHDGQDGLYYLLQDLYDVCLLDRMLPGLDGLAVLQRARAQGCATPVLMLTALGRVTDRVDGLEAGADDYLVKPFDMRELLARLRALCRRPAAVEPADAILCGNVTLLPSQLTLRGPDGTATLSKKECELLLVLLRNAGKLLSREVLLGRVWGAENDVTDASLDSYIHFVRRRLKMVGADSRVATVRGFGYKLEAAP